MASGIQLGGGKIQRYSLSRSLARVFLVFGEKLLNLALPLVFVDHTGM
jgi:hypothetical protein